MPGSVPVWIKNLERAGRPRRLISLRLACFTFLRFAPSLRNPAALGYQPKPSVVWAFAAPIPRLTLLRSKDQGPPSLAHPFTGTKVHWTFVCIRFTLFRCANPGFAIRGEAA